MAPAIIEKIRSSLSKDRSGNGDHDSDRGRDSAVPTHHSHLNPAHSDEAGRSTSRGRGLNASGRGGIGNMSTSRPPVQDEDPAVVAEARSKSRSRSRQRHPGHEDLVSSGRGGAGNVRSPSRDPAARQKETLLEVEDHNAQEAYESKHKGDAHGVGRGGFGNIHGLKHGDTAAATE